MVGTTRRSGIAISVLKSAVRPLLDDLICTKPSGRLTCFSYMRIVRTCRPVNVQDFHPPPPLLHERPYATTFGSMSTPKTKVTFLSETLRELEKPQNLSPSSDIVVRQILHVLS